MDEISGYIERITFQNDENGYTVAQLKQRGQRELTCIVGAMPMVQPGETIRCRGKWQNHLIHGRQFEVAECQTEAPADLVGIKKYLGSGLIKGIGPVYAEKIVTAFGLDTLHVIDSSPNRLSEIKGLGGKRIEKIKTCWSEQKVVREVMIFLQSYGVSPAFAQKVFRSYGQESIKKLKENPYNLARDIIGIGFKTADAVAHKMGIPNDSTQRIDSGIEYSLSELSGDGHVCYPVEEFLTAAQEMLGVPAPAIQARLNFLRDDNRIILNDLVVNADKIPYIWGRALFLCETGIAREIKRLRSGNCLLRSIDTDKALTWVQEKLSIELAQNQKEAIAAALVEKIQIITGGPGTGKSTITKALLSITDKLTGSILLAAPTGRAAKRMTEITGRKASTIHSMLQFNFKAGGFKHNRDNPLECDLIIIDEASMIDTMLMYSLLRAIPDRARVVFVGDINQLPSVGPGNVLKDLISSQMLSVTMLTEIFRQAAGSQIITSAHRINNGQFPDIRNLASHDFFFIEAEEPEQVLETIVDLVARRLPKKYNLHSINDIQVLTPMKRGIVGAQNLNIVLQEALNKRGNPLIRFGRSFLIGDKVMQIRNNYTKEVYNGDVGRIKEIDEENQQLTVTIDDRDILYPFEDLDELVLAYAVSVHKYQGSECPCVVMPVHTTHFKLLHRNLLYTGVTRGKRLVVLVGTKKAIWIAINNDEVKRRYTALVHWLHDQLQKPGKLPF